AAKDAAAVGERKCGADIWVAGKRQFGSRREDPNFGRVRRSLRRQDESRLGQAELARDRLHLRRRPPIAVEDDRQPITAEPALGKDIDRHELKRHLHGLNGQDGSRSPARRRSGRRSQTYRYDFNSAGNSANSALAARVGSVAAITPRNSSISGARRLSMALI